MTAAKRMALAFCCMLFGVLLLGAVGIVSTAVRSGFRYALPILQMLPVYLLFAFPGWVLALPFVLLFKDANGSRLWWILAIGAGIGPAFVTGWSWLGSGGRLDWRANGLAVELAFLIGFFTTAAYAFLIRHLAKRGVDFPAPG